MTEREAQQHQYKQTHDYVHEFRGYHDPGAVCRIRVYERAGDVPIVIATELHENTGTSITNMAEFLAAEIIARHFPQRFEEETPVTWIEHYPPIRAYGKTGKTLEYSLVDFNSYKPRVVQQFGGPRVRIGDPDWKHTEPSEVERIIGHKPD